MNCKIVVNYRMYMYVQAENLNYQARELARELAAQSLNSTESTGYNRTKGGVENTY